MPAPYEKLITYQQATEIYDLTFEFCRRFLHPVRDGRLTDQMVQAARSGKQNIVEGASNKSSLKSYIKLLSVARASLEELLADYLDFARQRGFEVWEKNDQRVLTVLRVPRGGRISVLFPSKPSTPSLPLNFLIDQIRKTTFLLEKQISALHEKFVKEGGFSENLFKERIAYRNQNANKARITKYN